MNRMRICRGLPMRILFILIVLNCAVHAGEFQTSRPASWAQPVPGVSLKNMFKVNRDVYRSKQPDEKDMAMLVAMGIRSVLNLRENHSDTDEAAGTELKLYRVPIETDKVSDAEIIAALRILAECPKPVLVHCWHGSDRTGCVIAAYRIVFQGWSKADAITELEQGGYGYHARTYPNITRYIRDMDVGEIRKQAGVSRP